ncbi:MAG: hypothetical protein COA78_07240 [Blastopirellula sp.]|nr:MAG: hypothetical protein COA78_07240 [Blastopirellula sp.]
MGAIVIVQFVRAVTALSLVGLVVAGCSKPLTPIVPTAPEVTVTSPVIRTVNNYSFLTGRATASEVLEARARVEGYLRKPEIEEGKLVKKGAPLFVIEQEPYKLALDEAEKTKKQSEAAQSLAQANFDRAKITFDKGAITIQEYQTQEAQLAVATAQVNRDQVAIDQALLTLSYTTINAPYDAHVGYLDIDEGNIVGVGENTLLATVNRYDPLHVYFDVSENIVLKALDQIRENRTEKGDVRNKLKIEVSFEGEDGYPHKGYLDVLDNEIDSATGTALVRGVIPNTKSSFAYYQKNGLLPDYNAESDSDKPQEFPLVLPGAYAEIRVIGEDVIQEACLIDERAIGTDLLGKYLLTVESDNTVTLNRIEMGQLYQGFRHIIRMWDPEKETTEAAVGQVDTRGKDFPTNFKYIIKGLQRARPGKKVKTSETTSVFYDTKIEDAQAAVETPAVNQEGPGT